MSKKRRVLVFCEYYPPARGGGGMTAVANMIGRFSETYDFFVITGNRLQPQSPEPIPLVRQNEWTEVDKAVVFFTEPSKLTRENLRILVKEAEPDAVFLNSAFSWPVLCFLRARRFDRTLRRLSVILAPCGEFLPTALAHKSLKKRVFLAYARLRGLYADLIWRASSPRELQAIKQVVGAEAEIMVAPDLTPVSILPDFSITTKPKKAPGAARFVFLSRLVKIKNLGFILDCLKEIRDAKIELEIIGPVEDRPYYELCRAIMKELPPTITISEVGGVSRDDALLRLERSHYLVMPTLGENFGFVVLEAMAAGCPILLSDRTDWDGVATAGAGWILPLDQRARWIETIRECVAHDEPEYRRYATSARDFALSWLSDPNNAAPTAELLEKAIKGSEREVTA